jgi:hypothetical protein
MQKVCQGKGSIFHSQEGTMRVILFTICESFFFTEVVRLGFKTIKIEAKLAQPKNIHK